MPFALQTWESTEESDELSETFSLIQAVQQGDQRASGVLVNKYNMWVNHIVNEFFADSDIAEDAIQLTWINIFSSIRTFTYNNPSEFKFWIATIARNVCINMKKSVPYRRQSFLSEQSEVADELALPLDDLLATERWQIVMILLERLDDKYRVPLTMFHLEHKSIRDIAVELELNEGTVGRRLFEGRVKLSELLHRLYPQYARETGCCLV